MYHPTHKHLQYNPQLLVLLVQQQRPLWATTMCPICLREITPICSSFTTFYLSYERYHLSQNVFLVTKPVFNAFMLLWEKCDLRTQPCFQVYPGRQSSHFWPAVPSRHWQKPVSLQRACMEPSWLQLHSAYTKYIYTLFTNWRLCAKTLKRKAIVIRAS